MRTLMRTLGGFLGAIFVGFGFFVLIFMGELSTFPRVLGTVSFLALGGGFLQFAFTGRESLFTPRNWRGTKDKENSTAE